MQKGAGRIGGKACFSKPAASRRSNTFNLFSNPQNMYPRGEEKITPPPQTTPWSTDGYAASLPRTLHEECYRLHRVHDCRCGRCHELDAFQGDRRSCKDQLAKHNARLELPRPALSPVAFTHGLLCLPPIWVYIKELVLLCMRKAGNDLHSGLRGVVPRHSHNELVTRNT